MPQQSSDNADPFLRCSLSIPSFPAIANADLEKIPHPINELHGGHSGAWRGLKGVCEAPIFGTCSVRSSELSRVSSALSFAWTWETAEEMQTAQSPEPVYEPTGLHHTYF